MSWDTTACFKAVCTAFCDFQRQPSEQTVQDLQRQIDVILGLTSHGAILNEFTPKQLVYAETLSALVSIINDPNLKAPLYLKSLMALLQLANDMETKLSLQNDFNLGSSVVGFILRHVVVNTTNKQMVLQALLLLEKMTYDSSCSINNIYMVDLLKQLINSIYTTASEFCIPSLAVLANLCRNNNDVKSFVKTMSDAKKFGKTLLSYLSNSNKTYSITSLSILAHLYLNDSLGENMFSGQNLINMIRLVFNVLIGNDGVTTRHYSIDLVIDFIKCEKTLTIIAGSTKLESDIFQILNLLHTTDARTAVKIFELLIEFCKRPSLCRKVIHVFMKNVNEAETQLADVVLSPAQSLLHWISRSERDDAVVQANVLSLVFLKDLSTEIIASGNIGNISVYINQVIVVLLPYLNFDVNIDDIKKIKQKFRKLACAFEVISILCKDNGLKDSLVEQIDFEAIFNVMVNILDKFSDDLNALRDPALACNQEITSVMFRGLELMSAVKHNFDSGLVRYSSLIQNTKLIPLLSHGLASNSKFLVHASLQIIAEGLKVSGFQSKMLGETLTFHNSTRQDLSMSQKHESNELFNQHSSQITSSQPLRDITNTTNKNLNSPRDSVSITSLAERLNKGLDIKDTKVSDIMGFYEHKLSALMGREKHIQDLLEAKSTTLTQTERLLAEYRCRHAQSEAEGLKLCSMLQTSERKCENDDLMINELKKTKQKADEEIKSFQSKIKVLESVAAEHEQLRNAFQEQIHKLQSLEKSLAAAKDEIVSLESTKNILIKTGENLQTELDGANEQLRLMGEEKKGLLSAIKDKEKEIKKLEKTLKETKDKVSSLEVFSQELEQTLSEKESRLSQLNVELEKQSQISAMIHNLTMGKLNVPGMSSMNTSK